MTKGRKDKNVFAPYAMMAQIRVLKMRSIFFLVVTGKNINN